MNKTAENLFALADFIEQNARPEQINMRWFVTERGELSLSVKPSSIPKNECGTAFCALGWEALRVPEVAGRFETWFAFSHFQFPELESPLHDRCFGGAKPSKKDTVVKVLREVAAEVAELGSRSGSKKPQPQKAFQ